MENDQVNGNKPSWAEAVAKPGQPPVSEKQMDMCISIMIDGKDRERRSKNVLIFGIEQSEKVEIRDRYVEDREKVDKKFSDLRIQSDKIVSIKRFREKPNSTYIPPILVELQSERDRTSVLSVAKQLRGYPQYSKVYINPDLTDAERKLDKELRIQRNIKNDEERANGTGHLFRWGIRGYVLKRFKTAPSNQSTNEQRPRAEGGQPSRGRGREAYF